MRRALRNNCSCGPKSNCSDIRRSCRKIGLKCNACRSSCCRNITYDTPSSDLLTKTSTKLKDNKSDTTNSAEDHSEEFSHIYFRLPSQEFIFHPYKDKNCFPIISTGNMGQTKIKRLYRKMRRRK